MKNQVQIKYPRQRSSRHLPCSSCQSFLLSEDYFWCEQQQPTFPQLCPCFQPEKNEIIPINNLKSFWGELKNAFI